MSESGAQSGAIWQTLADDPVLLTECIEYTARQTGFRPELVEKDFHCSVVLHAFAQAQDGGHAVFKGGTCLSKLSVTGNDPIDVSTRRHSQLARQVDSQLKPVLRRRDFESFNLDRVFDPLAQIATTLAHRR